MEIKSDMSQNYLKHYNIAKGIAVNKKAVLKKQTTKVPNYLTSALITIFLLSIFTILFIFLDKSNIFKTIFILSLIVYTLYAIIRTIWSYKFKKKNNFINAITLDENGLTDNSFYNIRITLKWDKLKALVIKKETITILTDTYLYFFFDIKEKEQILKAINKYNKNMIIIEEE